jgi:hypothetical protein
MIDLVTVALAAALLFLQLARTRALPIASLRCAAALPMR